MYAVKVRSKKGTLQRFNENPILEPVAEHPWEAKAVFNPGVCATGKCIHLLYRAMSHDDTSVIGYACTKDGVHIDERLVDPVYVPRELFEKKYQLGVGSGCEDPRLTKIGDRIYMCYTAYDGVNPPRIALSSISVSDLEAKEWKWSKSVLISPPGVDDKDAAIFPKKINGKFVILHRIGLSIWIDFVSSLLFDGDSWLGGKILMEPRKGISDSRKIGICGPPIETSDGWLLLYHGVSKEDDRRYVIRAALLDLNDPTHVLARTKHPIFEPEQSYEKIGLVSNVVFPCGSVVRDGMLHVYYGGADKVVGVATVELDQLLGLLREEKVLEPMHLHPLHGNVSQDSNIDESIRPWGHYEILDHGIGFQVKRLTIHSGHRFSYQRHHHRSEHWTIVSGIGMTTIEDVDQKRVVGDMISIPSGTKHRMANIGNEDLVFIEVQNGDYLGEDDIERFEDDYHRE